MTYNYEVINEKCNMIFHIKSENIISKGDTIICDSKIYKVTEVAHIVQKDKTSIYKTNLYVTETKIKLIIVEDK